MSARGRKDASCAEAAESSVYLGSHEVGSIVVMQKGRVIATDATGRRLGTFKTDREAMSAIVTAARATKGSLGGS